MNGNAGLIEGHIKELEVPIREKIGAEAALAGEIYRNRASINRKAQEVLAQGSRQITVRPDNNGLARVSRGSKPKV